MVIQLEYEVRTLQMIIDLREQGVHEQEIAERVGIGKSEVRIVTKGKLNKAKEQLRKYRKMMYGGNN